MIVFFFLAILSFVAAIATFLFFASRLAVDEAEARRINNAMLICMVWLIMSAFMLGGAMRVVL